MKWRQSWKSIIVGFGIIWAVAFFSAVVYLDPLHNSSIEARHLQDKIQSLTRELEALKDGRTIDKRSSDQPSSSPSSSDYKIIDRAGRKGPYKPHWESINSRPLPSWHDEAKFGIFIHWGVYSVPSYGDWEHWKYSPGAEWYWNHLGHPDDDGGIIRSFQNKHYPNELYQDFGERFTAMLWDPAFWADLVKDSGARYTVLTSKHHEGFCNWPSRWSWNWNSADIGPKRDIVAEYGKAIRDRNITFGLYYSLYEWWNPLYLSDKSSGTPAKTSEYVDTKMLPEMMDLVNRYQPSVLWTDGDWEQDSSYWKSPQFLAWLYNESPSKDHVVVNDRWGPECRGNRGGYWTPSDGYNPGRVIEHKTIGTSWGYNRKEQLKQMKSSQELIEELITVVAYGGNYLLNLSPTSDGLIPLLQEERLRDIGKWMKVNGEAIYATRPCTVQKDPGSHNVWYTCKPQDRILFAISYDWPDDNKLRLQNPAIAADTKITFLLSNQQIKYKRIESTGELILDLPVYRPDLTRITPWVFRITNAE